MAINILLLKEVLKQEQIITESPFSNRIFQRKIIMCNNASLLFLELWTCLAMTSRSDGINL